MNKQLFVVTMFLTLLLGLSIKSVAQSSIKLTTQKSFGDNLSLWVKPESKDIPIRVDWGDGQIMEYTINPDGMPYERKLSGPIFAETITLYGKFREVECTEELLTGVIIQEQDILTVLDLSKNRITRESLDLSGAINLESLNMTENALTLLDLSALEKLQFVSAGKNPALGGVLISPRATSLKQLSLEACDLAHFYPIELPALTALNLSENALQELEIGDYYPALSSLNVRDNQLQSLTLDQCPNLTKLEVDNNLLSQLNLQHNPELINLSCSNNTLTELYLETNGKLTGINCEHNKLISLSTNKQSLLQDLSVSSNPIKSLDLSTNTYLKTLRCAETLLPVLNLYSNPNLKYLDCRNNTAFTPHAVDFMIRSMWPSSSKAWSSNLLLEGTDITGVSFDDITSAEYGWLLDITPDESLPTLDRNPVKVTVKQTVGGIVELTYFDLRTGMWQALNDAIIPGTPILYVSHPEDGYILSGIKINDQLIDYSPFVITQESLLEPIWSKPSIMTLGTQAGHPISFALTADADTDILVDWGDGKTKSYTLLSGQITRLDDIALGDKITIIGQVSIADFSSYPGMDAWDNEFSSFSCTDNDLLRELHLYMNSLSKMSIDGCRNLELLDCAYTNISDLSIKEFAKLYKLLCYGNTIESLDLSQNAQLTYLDAHNNHLKTINLVDNPLLEYLDLQSNLLTSIDLSTLTNLIDLKLASNLLETIDLKHNTEIQTLNVESNKLTSLTSSMLTNLVILYCGNNRINGLDLSSNKKLSYLNCTANGLSACALNDLYHHLPTWSATPEGFNLADNVTLRISDATATDAPNDAEYAESVLATYKGWTLNQIGDGSGCDEAYIILLPTDHGSLAITTDQGDIISSGDKLPKQSIIQITPKPEEGYLIDKITINGKALTSFEYSISGATFIRAIFKQDDAIERLQSSRPYTITGRTITVNVSQAQAYLYTASGLCIRQYQEGVAHTTLEPGEYLLQICSNEPNRTYKIVIF